MNIVTAPISVPIDLKSINYDITEFRRITTDNRIVNLIKSGQLIGELQPQLNAHSSLVDVSTIHLENAAFRIKEFMFIYPSNKTEEEYVEMTIEFDGAFPKAKTMLDGNVIRIVSYRPRIIGTRNIRASTDAVSDYLITVDAYINQNMVWRNWFDKKNK